MVVNMKTGVFWDAMPCGSCKNRRFGGTYASVIRVTRIGELGTALTDSCHHDDGGAKFLRNVGSYKNHTA
jgi:hypothetical protein